MGNKACLQMLGYTEEEFVQLGVADLHPEADLPFIYAQIETFLKGASRSVMISGSSARMGAFFSPM